MQLKALHELDEGYDGTCCCIEFKLDGVEYTAHCPKVCLDGCDCEYSGIHVSKRTDKSRDLADELVELIYSQFGFEPKIKYGDKNGKE
jgi:hypothetical protein